MPVWTNASNGSWSDSSRWTGGIPNGAGAVAEFAASNAASVLMIISFPQDAVFTVGTLNIVTDADDGWVFRGVIGATAATLRFQGANGAPAFINVDTNGSTRESSLASDQGFRVTFISDVILTTSNSDTLFRISAPISGDGDLYKFGDGTLVLNGANANWGGDLNLLAGRTEVSSTAAGSAKITLGNDAVLAASGTFANRIQVNDDAQSSTISAFTASTLTLSGLLISESNNGVGVRFGSNADAGTIVLTGTNLLLGDAGFTIGGGIVRLGSASVAANYFSNLPSQGLLQVAGTLDTNGLATFLDNLDMDGGTILSGGGALNLTVNDTLSLANAQAGTIQGTVSSDRIVVNVLNNFSFGSLTFSSWTAGTDTITFNGSEGVNNISGSLQNDVINGFGGADSLAGGNGNDLLDGGAGNDTMQGNAGDDTFFVSEFADVVQEGAGGGNDTIFTTTSYVLAAGQSVEILAARDNSQTVEMNLLGNELVNTIFGNNGKNFIDGGAGADIMTGFGGDDTYAIDNGGDVVDEGAGGGTDAIFTSFSYVLGLGMSVEILASRDNSQTIAMNLFGNELANFIFGNNGTNFIDGGTGADTMTGFGGDDTYVVDNVGDRVVEDVGGGSDSIFTGFSYALSAGHSIEVLASRDNSLTTAMDLTGNELGNTLLGNNGVNRLDGLGGNDVLMGFGGADIFAFTTAPAAGNADFIADFVAGTDKIGLDDAVFQGIGTPGNFTGANFVAGTAALDVNDRIIYNAANGQLLYDADGSGAGAAVLIATLQGNPVLSASDFQVI